MERRGKRNRSPDRNLDEKVLLVDKTNTNSGSADENAAIAPKAKQEKKTTKHTRRSARKSANAVVMLQATDVDSSDAADDKNDQVSSKRPEELHALVNFKKETETGIQLERCPSSSTESADEQSLIAEKLNATSSQTEEKTENPNLNSNAKKMENSEENIRKSLEELPQLTSDVIYQQCNGGEDEELAKNDLIISKTELSSYDGSVLSDELTQYSSIASSVMKIEPEEECEFQFIKIAKETNVNDNSLDRIIQELAKRSETSLPKENTKRSNIKRKKTNRTKKTTPDDLLMHVSAPDCNQGKSDAEDLDSNKSNQDIDQKSITNRCAQLDHKNNFKWSPSSLTLLFKLWFKQKLNIEEGIKLETYKEMAAEITSAGFELNAMTVRQKISRLRMKYRSELKSIELTGMPSKWPLFKHLHKIMGDKENIDDFTASVINSDVNTCNITSDFEVIPENPTFSVVAPPKEKQMSELFDDIWKNIRTELKEIKENEVEALKLQNQLSLIKSEGNLILQKLLNNYKIVNR